jgi:hypothetical protein
MLPALRGSDWLRPQLQRLAQFAQHMHAFKAEALVWPQSPALKWVPLRVHGSGAMGGSLPEPAGEAFTWSGANYMGPTMRLVHGLFRGHPRQGARRRTLSGWMGWPYTLALIAVAIRVIRIPAAIVRVRIGVTVVRVAIRVSDRCAGERSTEQTQTDCGTAAAAPVRASLMVTPLPVAAVPAAATMPAMIAAFPALRLSCLRSCAKHRRSNKRACKRKPTPRLLAELKHDLSPIRCCASQTRDQRLFPKRFAPSCYSVCCLE